ncbi:MAG: cyclic nucleotide-binding domain-containing protein [Desulfobacterales bacterium]|jgi:CRP-like cAMP-binding protein
MEDLKSIIMLSDLNSSMLEKTLKVTKKTTYSSGEYIFKEGDYAEYLYAVLNGKVGLELQKNTSTLVMISTITRGYAFGFSALVDTENRRYISHAKALSDINLLKWSVEDLRKLFHKDCEMGYLLMKRIAKIAKKRLQVRNAQFLEIYR